MNYYWTCPKCGSNLDPGESCDCYKTDNSYDSLDNYKVVQGGEENDTTTGE